MLNARDKCCVENDVVCAISVVTLSNLILRGKVSGAPLVALVVPSNLLHVVVSSCHNAQLLVCFSPSFQVREFLKLLFCFLRALPQPWPIGSKDRHYRIKKLIEALLKDNYDIVALQEVRFLIDVFKCSEFALTNKLLIFLHKFIFSTIFYLMAYPELYFTVNSCFWQKPLIAQQRLFLGKVLDMGRKRLLPDQYCCQRLLSVFVLFS